MTTSPAPRTGARILVDQLLALGADLGFCVPGESYLAVLDALWESRARFRLVTCRNEGGAAFMADAAGKLTGRPGLCFVTRGPGACNAAIGVHTAQQDSTPMLLFIGQIGRGDSGREAFQEVDYRQMFGGLAKWVTQIDDAARIPEVLGRAWHLACSGRPGPVVIALPEDMLTDTASVADAPPAPVAHPAPDPVDLARLDALLRAAERPLAIVGGSGWTDAGRAALHAFASAWQLPVAAGFRRQDVFDNAHPAYAGELGTSVAPALARRVQEADLLLVLGSRLGEMTTNGYTLVAAPTPAQTLVHVLPDAAELNRVYRPQLAIATHPARVAEALAALAPPALPAWTDWSAAARAERAANLRPGAAAGALDMNEVMRQLEARLPADAIVCNGAGNYTGWPQRFHAFRHYPSQLAPTSGAMGYGVPAAIAAQAVFPQRLAVGFAGDGCFQMNGQELATAVQHGLAPLIVVVDNGMYGTIRMHQERHYPERSIATALTNPDFAALARACGGHGETVETTADFAPALDRALAAGRLALLHLKVDPELITTRTTLSALRAAAR
ncbi:acetolactate synthase large subunit [Plasticicumulans lactativorans]|uniref:Acetolactate synthase large subunit n=1 Tax=Plasticicumulans lactativorans TaxID=1133106 RepID=A0A4R2L456_9GAMM|nr:thiamine pyrophosphate-binding protein [Plasticicumulans lactativorans]TCO81997.1 acetolactate synthase large subunit [Plasticicumulans lactativorans]